MNRLQERILFEIFQSWAISVIELGDNLIDIGLNAIRAELAILEDKGFIAEAKQEPGFKSRKYRLTEYGRKLVRGGEIGFKQHVPH